MSTRHPRRTEHRRTPRWPRRAACRDERGAVLVEFALVVPLLLCLIMGCFTGSMVYTDHIAETNAVREAARYGASADISSPTAWTASVRDRVRQTYFDAAAKAVTDDQICVELVQSTGTVYASAIGANCGSAPPLPTGMAAGSCAVLVWMSRSESINLIVFPSPHFNSGAQSVAFYSRVVKPTCTAS